MTLVLGDPNVTAFLKALSLHRFCLTCTPTHVAENSFTLTTCLAIQGQYFSELECSQIWCGCHTSGDSGDLSQAPPKQSAVCSTCIIPVPPANYLDGHRLRHECHPTYLAVTLDHTLSYREHLTKTYRQAEEPKQLVDEVSGFNLERQRQVSAVICSGTLLFSSRVLTQVRSVCS